MQLGKTMESYFEKDCNTSWVIDALEQNDADGHYYDTLKLYRVFTLRLTQQEHNCSAAFYVSLYVQRESAEVSTVYNSKLTLSKIKTAYAGEHLGDEDAADDDFLVALFADLHKVDRAASEQDVALSTPIAFRAQAANWSTRGKTKTYHIVGVSLQKIC